MTALDIIDISRDGILVMLKIAAPTMIAGLIVGLIISLIQALTQIQEMTLVFIPKIIIVCAVFLLSLPFMIATIVTFAQQLAGRIAGIG
ncbi:MAG: flagellar type III secretion system protein FliQ [Proteobacteria bacterium]|jgi:flagellar biosynthetic protein FliQ|nr:flagellar type III secretion system protein FliQ [Pseudomonadota bacterium]